MEMDEYSETWTVHDENGEIYRRCKIQCYGVSWEKLADNKFLWMTDEEHEAAEEAFQEMRLRNLIDKGE